LFQLGSVTTPEAAVRGASCDFVGAVTASPRAIRAAPVDSGAAHALEAKQHDVRMLNGKKSKTCILLRRG
jgi:hypothetical protein